jgi:nucleoside-diphosphate-sugar epimerase
LAAERGEIMNRTTVLGSSGFIGRHLVAALRGDGYEVVTPGRNEDLNDRDLGTVYYCIGLTADFRKRPFDTVTAHVGRLQEVLRTARFDRLVYLSSTRVYDSTGTAATGESTPLKVNSDDPSDLYNLSKLLGESLVLNAGRPGVVARLSNVAGPDFESENFVPSLIRDAVKHGRIELRSDPQSAKDYILISDAIRMLMAIGAGGRERIYNVASGRNVTHAVIVDRLRELTGCEVAFSGGPRSLFPPIDTTRIRGEFGFAAANLESELPRLVQQYREWLTCPT